MINTLTLNPAIDKILYVDKFERNVTTRINRIAETIGGKGTHVSVNLKLLGMDNRAFGIAHGPTGKRVIDRLRAEKVDVRFLYREDQDTRTNYLLAESTGDSTLITEKGVMLCERDLEDVIAKIKAETREEDFLVFSGDASNYADPMVYNHIIRAVRGCGLKIFLDTSGKSLLKCVQESPFLIKPNLDELSALCGRPVAEDDADVMAAIDSLDRYNIEVVAVSLGGNGSLVKYRGGYFRAYPARVNVKNTVGCGDCFLAGMLYGFEQGMEIVELLKFATATGGAAAECELSVGLDADRAWELKENVIVKKLK